VFKTIQTKNLTAMKNFYPFLFLLAFLFSFQNQASSQSKFGIKGGINLANIFAEQEGVSISFQNNLGLVGGLVYTSPVSEKFDIQTELLFVQKGFAISIPTFGNTETTINYIDVPILGKFKFGNGNSKFFLNLGPNFGYAISGNTSFDGNKDKIEFDEDFKRFDLGLNVGGGIEINATNSTFFLEARYNVGISQINEQLEIDDPKIKNKGISFTIGMFF
jgi:hypothetical protein